MTTIASPKWIAQKRYKDRNKEKLKLSRDRTKEWEATKKRRSTPEGWAKSRIHYIKHRAKKKGLDFDLTWKDIVPEKTCPVFHIPFDFNSFGKPGATPYAPSVDRKDNTKGYIKGNVFVISNRANLLKKDATSLEMAQLLKYMEDR